MPEKLELFIVWNAEWDAPAAGVLRAITLRFCTLEDGVATCPLMLCAPKELLRVGAAEIPFVT